MTPDAPMNAADQPADHHHTAGDLLPPRLRRSASLVATPSRVVTSVKGAIVDSGISPCSPDSSIR